MRNRMSTRFPIQNRRFSERFRHVYPICRTAPSDGVPGYIRKGSSQVLPYRACGNGQFTATCRASCASNCASAAPALPGGISIRASRSRREAADVFPAPLICNGFLSASALPRWRQAMSTLVSTSPRLCATPSACLSRVSPRSGTAGSLREEPKPCWPHGYAGNITGSVDCWLLATILQGPLGGVLSPVTASGRDLVIATLRLRGVCLLAWRSPDPIARRRTTSWGTQWGQSNGRLWCGSHEPCFLGPPRLGSRSACSPPCNSSAPSWGLPCGAVFTGRRLGSR